MCPKEEEEERERTNDDDDDFDDSSRSRFFEEAGGDSKSGPLPNGGERRGREYQFGTIWRRETESRE